MGLKENIDAGESAVAEVKRHVQYASPNLKGDRVASYLKSVEEWEATEGVWQKQQAAALKSAETSQRVSSGVKTKAAFFEQAATLPSQPAKLNAPSQLDLSKVPTGLDYDIERLRGQRDPQTGAVIVRGVKSRAYWQMVRQGAPKDMYTELLANAWAAKQCKVGNCGEQAAIAFLFLEGITSAPLDYMTFGNTTQMNSSPVYDHSWLVIGRLGSSNPHQVRTWGPDAVWCDPWQLREGRVYSIDDLVKRKATNLDSAFKLNTAELVDAGLPEVLYRRV